MSDGGPELIVGSRRCLPDQRLELRERHFYGVQVGTAGRQEQEPGADGAKGRRGAGALWLDRLSRMTTSPSRRVGTSRVSAQRVNISLFIAPSMTQGASSRSWRRAATLPAGRPARRPGHVGLHRSFIDEDQAFQMVGHEGLTLRDPDAALFGDVLSLLLKRLKVFFCVPARGHAAPRRCHDARRCHASGPVPPPIRRG